MGKQIYYEGCRGELTPVKDYRFEDGQYRATVSEDYLCYREGETITSWWGYHFVTVTRRTQYHTYVKPAPLSEDV